MGQNIFTFKDLPDEYLHLAGGKGASLSKMFKSGYPVPNGFIILPSAFYKENIIPEAREEIKKNAAELGIGRTKFAVRSSGLCEDSSKASFAGEFETVLDVHTEDELLAAICTVIKSADSERVRSYSQTHEIDENHQMAVVVQRMVKSEISGVLFTADPITGSHKSMVGNYVYGMGEQLVSGEADAYQFKYIRPKGKYIGSEDFKRYSGKLLKLAHKIERSFNFPQDIEWAIEGGKVYILQSRPITTIKTINQDAYEINESLDGDFLWTSNNAGEAVPDVMTPFTWSIIRELDIECQKVTGFYLWSGNICGRAYSNLSMSFSVLPALGLSKDRIRKLISDFFGNIPEGMEIPLYPFKTAEAIKEIFNKGLKNTNRINKSMKKKEYYLEHTKLWCEDVLIKLDAANSEDSLLYLWNNEIRPYISRLWEVSVGAASVPILFKFRKELVKLAGEEQANQLCSNFKADSGLKSLGPLVGIEKIINNEMSKEEFISQYGHRSPHEFEVSLPYPAEDENYVYKLIEEHKAAGMDITVLLDKQHEQHLKAKEQFIRKYPQKRKWLEKNVSKVMDSMQTREALRNEFVKGFRVMRNFLLKVGAITGIHDDVFFIYSFEIPELLSSNKSVLKNIPMRKQNYQKCLELPVFPQFIRGSFNPFEWAKDKNRRLDYFDASMEAAEDKGSSTIKGFAGAIGKVEGIVRLINSYEETDSFLQGEILLTTTTNVGWTPLFPKAAAIITDVGAPLSHAAIVARELGIPAVVGCGNATAILKSGDHVIVDGGQGTVVKL